MERFGGHVVTVPANGNVETTIPITGRLLGIIVSTTVNTALTVTGVKTNIAYINGTFTDGYHLVKKLAVDTDASALTATGNIYAEQPIPGEKLTIAVTTAATITLLLEN